MNNTDDNWNIVVKKNKEDNKKPNKYLRTSNSNITKKDTTLTTKEKQIIENDKLENSDLNIFCNCCCNDLISDIIKRSFFFCEGCNGCEGCYCCNDCEGCNGCEGYNGCEGCYCCNDD